MGFLSMVTVTTRFVPVRTPVAVLIKILQEIVTYDSAIVLLAIPKCVENLCPHTKKSTHECLEQLCS